MITGIDANIKYLRYLVYELRSGFLRLGMRQSQYIRCKFGSVASVACSEHVDRDCSLACALHADQEQKGTSEAANAEPSAKLSPVFVAGPDKRQRMPRAHTQPVRPHVGREAAAR